MRAGRASWYGWTHCEGCGAQMPSGGPTTGSAIGRSGYACHECVARGIAYMDGLDLRCSSCGVQRQRGDWGSWLIVGGPGLRQDATCPACCFADAERVR